MPCGPRAWVWGRVLGRQVLDCRRAHGPGATLALSAPEVSGKGDASREAEPATGAGQRVLPRPPGTLYQTSGSRDLEEGLWEHCLAAHWLVWILPQPVSFEARSSSFITPSADPDPALGAQGEFTE